VVISKIVYLILHQTFNVDIAELDGGKICTIDFPDPNKLDHFESVVTIFCFAGDVCQFKGFSVD
jgi:hypothetical protein